MWNQLPERFGKWNSIWRTFKRWSDKGMWDWILEQFREKYGDESIILMLDATHIKAHQDASRHPASAEERKLGKTKGGFNTKISAATNYAGLPVSMKLVCGNEHDSISAVEVLSKCLNGSYVLADKAYDTNAIREFIVNNDSHPVIPPKSNRKTIIEYDKSLGKLRHKVENYFASMKRYRRLSTR